MKSYPDAHQESKEFKGQDCTEISFADCLFVQCVFISF